MEKKEHEQQEGKKESQEKHLLFVLGVIFLLVIGGIAWLFTFSKERTEELAFEYNGFNFKRIDYGYQVEVYINQNINPSHFTIRYKPQDLENISIPPTISQEIRNKKQVFVLIDPYAKLTGVTTMATLELENVIDNPFLLNIPLNASFTQPYEKVPSIPVLSCADATEETAIIYMTLGEKTEIYKKNKCIVFEAVVEDDFIREANRLSLTVLNIMKP